MNFCVKPIVKPFTGVVEYDYLIDEEISKKIAEFLAKHNKKYASLVTDGFCGNYYTDFYTEADDMIYEGCKISEKESEMIEEFLKELTDFYTEADDMINDMIYINGILLKKNQK
jgi:hypothetical protein